MYLIEYGVLQHENPHFVKTLFSLNRKLTNQSTKHLLIPSGWNGDKHSSELQEEELLGGTVSLGHGKQSFADAFFPDDRSERHEVRAL